MTTPKDETYLSDEGPLSPDAFVAHFRKELRLEGELVNITLDTSLLDDLEFDSLRMLETVGVLFELLGLEVELDQEVFEALSSFRSLYLYYVTLASMPTVSRREDHQVQMPSPPPLEGLRTKLHPPLAVHFGPLYDIAINNEIAWRWRFRGAMPSLDAFVQSFGAGVLSQFVVLDRTSNETLGLVVAYNPDLQNGHASVATVMGPKTIHTGIGVEATILFLNYLFRTWNFHKVYMEAPEFNFASYSSGVDRFFRIEGRLKQHHYFRGRHWDQIICAVYRDEFLGSVGHFESAILANRDHRRDHRATEQDSGP